MCNPDKSEIPIQLILWTWINRGIHRCVYKIGRKSFLEPLFQRLFLVEADQRPMQIFNGLQQALGCRFLLLGELVALKSDYSYAIYLPYNIRTGIVCWIHEWSILLDNCYWLVQKQISEATFWKLEILPSMTRTSSDSYESLMDDLKDRSPFYAWPLEAQRYERWVGCWHAMIPHTPRLLPQSWLPTKTRGLTPVRMHFDRIIDQDSVSIWASSGLLICGDRQSGKSSKWATFYGLQIVSLTTIHHPPAGNPCRRHVIWHLTTASQCARKYIFVDLWNGIRIPSCCREIIDTIMVQPNRAYNTTRNS